MKACVPLPEPGLQASVTWFETESSVVQPGGVGSEEAVVARMVAPAMETANAVANAEHRLVRVMR
ncbi:hypothetical protein AWN90_00745 [Nocardia terpenica]|uniref:Uncharacterized protein n=1 Tax=Nocardia terpenica TaxID=455432 RepID=A0A164KFB5_9NOCA|nr:hypothetical protein AWN90_00745 [Nocardia terpenica]